MWSIRFLLFCKAPHLFGDHETGPVKEEKIIPEEDELVLENVEDPELLKQKLTEAYVLIEQAKEEKNKGHYFESEKMLLHARKIKEKLLGPEHLEMAELDYELTEVYDSQGSSQEAINYYLKAYKIC